MSTGGERNHIVCKLNFQKKRAADISQQHLSTIYHEKQLRRQDSNLRSSGYEPDGIPTSPLHDKTAG